MNRLQRTIACAVAVIASLFVVAPGAQAQTVLLPAEVEQQAALIVNGAVVESSTVFVDGEPHRIARIESIEAVKGSVEGDAIFVETRGGDLPGGLTMVSSHTPTLELGDQVQVALEEAPAPVSEVAAGLDPSITTYSVVGGEEGAVRSDDPGQAFSASSSGNYALSGASWPGFSEALDFWVNPANSGLPTNVTIAAVQKGFQVWEDDNGSSVDFNYAGTSTATGVNLGDDKVTVSWVNSSGGWLAQADWIMGGGGEILSFDVRMNRSFLWADGAQSGRYDIGTVISHEVGHGIGLSHVPQASEVLFPDIVKGTVKPLGDGDRGGVRFLYPKEQVGYVPINPSRILDTRNTTHGSYSTPWGQDETRTVQVAGVAGVPSSGVDAVAIQVTSVNPTASNSYFTMWGVGYRPASPSKNFGTTASGSSGHAAITNDLVIVPVAPDGSVQGYNWHGQVDIVMDVVGYYTEGGGSMYSEVSPARILDTRDSIHGDYSTPWSQDETRSVKVAGVGGIPNSADAVVMHVTSVNPTATSSYMTVWATGNRPTAASKNYGNEAGGSTGHTAVTNDLIIVPVGANGNVNVYNWHGEVDIVIDVVGYYSSTGDLGFVDMRPARVLDSRNTTDGAYSTPWGRDETRSVQVTGLGDVPTTDVYAVVLRVTSLDPTGPMSFMTIWGPGGRPLAAAKNYGTVGGGLLGHAAITNETLIVPVAADGTVQIYNSRGEVDFTVDVVGYYIN